MVTLVLALSLAGAPPREKPVTDQKAVKCLVELHVDRGQSPWQGMTGSAEEEAAGKKVTAVDDLSKLEKVPHLASYDVDGRALLAIDRGARKVVASAEHFGELQRADVTQSGKTELGVVKSAALRKDPRRLVTFLIEAQVIQTLAHVESRVCLVSEKDEGNEYRAQFKGEHVYFTNKRHEAPLDFEVVLDRKSGAVRVEAR